MTQHSTLKQRLVAAAMEAGAQKVGFAHAVEVDADNLGYYQRWLAAGNNGGMGYLENHPAVRRDPRKLLENAEAHTVMVCAFSYYHPETQSPDAARIAMYAHGSDYHEVLRQRLQTIKTLLESEGCSARICVDSAPLMERYWAVRAGIGFIGRNRMLIVPHMGSYLFLAEIITDAPVEPDEPCTLSCGDCGRCTAACPGGALRSPGGFDSRLCLSYLTIEHRGDLPATLTASDGTPRPLCKALGNRVYGCDECQRVCPHNANPPETAIAEFHMRPTLHTLTRERILAMTQADFSEIFAHSAVKRTKLAGLQRNAIRRSRT